jgi:superfamily II DNA or RNA helicase
MTNIHFSVYNNLYIKVDADDVGVIRDIEEYLTDYKKGYLFMPRYRSGIWNGKISIFNKPTRSFPYGLLPEVLKHLKKEWSEDVKFSMDSDVKGLFGSGNNPEFKYDLNFQPYPYQQECTEALVKATKGLVIVATAGGKSLIIAYIIKNLPTETSKTLIIVPTLQLVDQFKGDLIDYGFPEDWIGSVNASKKEFDKQIVVSTWQSLKNTIGKVESFDAIICDEVHTAAADTISGILKDAVNAKYRFGVTGTLPTNRLDALTVQSFIGPVLKTFTGRDLADLGYVSKCVIKQVHIKYSRSFGSDYNTIRDEVFISPFRLGVIRGLAKNTKNTMLILVERIEKEGMILESYLREQLPEKNIVFLSGKDKSSVRDVWRKDMNYQENIVCIATYPIFQQGVNIPALREIVLASSTKSFIRVIQSLGRTLRKHVSKELGGAVMWDICDDVKHLKDHAVSRYKHYVKEKHEVEEITIEEK